MNPVHDAVWQSFSRISEDLALLEDQFQDEHQAVLHSQVAQMNAQLAQELPQVPPAEVDTEDEAFLTTLADELADRLKPLWSDPAVVATYLKLHDLKQDNHTMACEIDALERTNAALNLENKLLKEQLAQFHHLLGSFYRKR